MKNYLLLCGGVGGAKLALGFKNSIDPKHLTIAVNTGDDFTHLDFKICPDLDTVMYTLAGESDVSKGWGRRDESWNMLSALDDMGGETWFQLGDKDLATHIQRTQLLRSGLSLTQATHHLCESFNLQKNIFPMCNQPVETYIQTKNRLLSFQEYFVKLKCEPPVTDFVFKGLDKAEFNKDLDLSTYDEIIICPSNPYVSINPMLQLGALSKHLQDFSQKVTVISPIVNSKSLKGPTAKMMLELGHQISVVTIGKFYQNYSQRIFIDTSDLKESSKLNELGYEVNNANLIMNNTKSKNALAHEIIQLLESR
jgi:LPPG:FO 2-phospho-L-lactate transferase|tara:strand:- start:2429 stop:3358 length:930 start_codon:yes stop_codon:yes gene_type:complete